MEEEKVGEGSVCFSNTNSCIYMDTKVLYIEDDQVLVYFFKREKFSLVVYDSINDTLEIPEIQNNIHDLVQDVYLPEIYVESLISPFS